MAFPWIKAKPAKLKWASRACHVIASLIFLNWLVTFVVRAGFSVCYHPCNVLTLISIFDLPLCCKFTRARPMSLNATFETENVATFAFHLFERNAFTLNAIFTTRFRAPSNIFVVVCETFAMKFHVLSKWLGITRKHLFPERMIDFQWAFQHWTSCLEAEFCLR